MFSTFGANTNPRPMNEETQKVLNEFMQQMLQFAQDAGAFASEQIPEVLREIIVWGIASGILWMLVAMIGSYVAYRMLKRAFADDDWEDYPHLVIPGVSMLCVFTPLFFVNAFDVAKAIFAPRLYLIEEVASMIKGGC